MDDDKRTRHESESRAIASPVLYCPPEIISPLLQPYQVLLKVNDAITLDMEQCFILLMWENCDEVASLPCLATMLFQVSCLITQIRKKTIALSSVCFFQATLIY